MRKRDLIVNLAFMFCVSVLLLVTVPTSSLANVYDPWRDINGDGKIDMKDIGYVVQSFGTSGTPLEKASIEYDSGWIDITDKCGQYFNITHNLNSTNAMLDITGKTTQDSGAHQRYLGLTGRILGWGSRFGGVSNDQGNSLVLTGDGGYAITGYTTSFGAGGFDVYLVKTDGMGNMQCNKTYGGTKDDAGSVLVLTSDGGYAITGGTLSFGAGSFDVYLVKTDSLGNMQWNKTYGDIKADVGSSLVQSSDGGYVITGETRSYGAGQGDFWLVKTDAEGNIQWNKTYGGTNQESALSLIQTVDGGYAIAGYTLSFGAGGADVWLVKTDGNGTMQWNKTYGGTNYDIASTIVQTADGGYAMAGWTDSFGTGSIDVYLVKTDSLGNMQWNKTYGGIDVDAADPLIQTVDGGYAMAGATSSFGSGDIDVWLVKVDADGGMQWNKTYGGTYRDEGCDMVLTGDGGYAITGYTTSFGAGGFDVYLVKTDAERGLAWTDSTADTITLYRGATDTYWNFVRVRIWKIKTS